VAKAKKAVFNKKAGQIFIGVGGWTFPPWRSTFYPEKLPHHRELEYAASKLTSIEINGTYSQFPLLLREQTSRSCIGMSEKCQEATFILSGNEARPRILSFGNE